MNMQCSIAPGSSRREFLKTSAVAVAGAGLVSALAPPVHAAGSDTLKIALIGCGNRGTGALVQALNTSGSVKLWALADTFSDRVEMCLEHVVREVKGEQTETRASRKGKKVKAAAKSVDNVSDKIDLPKDPQFVGLDAYHKAIESGVDVVLLAQPPGYRPQHFEYAIRAGKHVFMEKPVATDPAGIRRVLAAAEEAKKKNLKVGVGLQRRHQLGYLETMKRLHGGEIGEIVSMRCYWNGTTPWLKTRASLEEKAGHKLSEMEYQMRNWYYFVWLCGDHIVEQHIHNLDVMNWVKNGPPIRAHGMGGCEVRKGPDYGEIFDHHAVEFEYADGSRMFSQCRHINGCWNDVSEHAVGTKGRCNIAGHTITGDNAWRFRDKGRDPYQQEHDDLFDAIRNDKPYNEAERGATSSMTAIFGRMATYSGKV